MNQPSMRRAVLAAWLAGVGVAAMTPVVAAAQSGDRLVPVYAGRVEMQRELTALLEDRLRVIARPHDVYAAVQLTMRGEIRQTEKGGEPGAEMKIGSQQQMSLPGLPAIDRNLTGVGAPNISVKIPGRKGEVQRAIESEIENIRVQLYVDPAMPPDVRERVQQLAIGLAGLDSARGDSLGITDLAPGKAQVVDKAGLPPWALLVCGTALVTAIILAAGLGAGARAKARGTGDVNLQLGDTSRGGEDGADPTTAAAAGVAAATNVNVKLTAEERAQRGFVFLETVLDDEMVELLQALDPEVAAVVIDRVGVKEHVAKQYFDTLDAPKRLALSVALGKARVLPREYLGQVEARVQWELDQIRSRVKLGGEKVLVEMLAHMSAAAQQQLLAELAEKDPALAQAVRGKMLLFEDIASMPQAAVRAIVTSVNPAVAAMALRDAPEAIRDAVMGAVSKRLRGIIEAEAEATADKTQADVETARKNVEAVMRRLQAAGMLNITPSA